MKRFLSLAFLLILVAGTIPGSGETAEIQLPGRWDVCSIEMTVEGLGSLSLRPEDTGFYSEIYLFSDGTGLLTTPGTTYKYSVLPFNWQQEENTIHTSTSEEFFYYPEENLLCVDQGSYAFYYQKNESWSYQPEVDPNASIDPADYYGTWIQCATDGTLLNLPGVIAGDLGSTIQMYEFLENGGRECLITKKDASRKSSSMQDIIGIRDWDDNGVLQLACNRDKVVLFPITVYTNGWISMVYNTNSVDYRIFFERTDQTIESFYNAF